MVLPALECALSGDQSRACAEVVFHQLRVETRLCLKVYVNKRTVCSARNANSTAGTLKHSTASMSLQARLQAFGLAGIVSYGLLNTMYYITAFFLFWTRVAKVPRGVLLIPCGLQYPVCDGSHTTAVYHMLSHF